MNVNEQSYSKEAIKARMLQNATKLWGVKSIQSLDPFVKLLIDAFSTEVFKANNEIQSINARILQKLAGLLTPSRYAHPTPARAVAYCMPDEDRQILPAHTEFFLKKQLNFLQKDKSDQQVEIPLTAVDHIHLVRAQTALQVAGNTAYSIDGQLNKIPIARLPLDVGEYRNVRVGIDISDYTSDAFPEKFALYGSNPTYEHVDFVYRLLPFVRVYHSGIQLKVAPGISYALPEAGDGFEGIFEEQSLKQKIKQDVKDAYSARFIEISGIGPAAFRSIAPGLPLDLDDGTAVWEQFRDRRFLWLTIEFPPQFTAEILENFLFVLNAFPVYNRGWKKTEYALDIMGNNIPLNTAEAEHFLYVDEVMDGGGKRYREIPFSPAGQAEKGLYSLRKGGMERFSSRNAVDLMANVMELLRDEVAAFSIISKDRVKEVLAEISEKMKGLMQRVDAAGRELHQDVNYVIIEPLEDSAHTYAAFWVTHCALANNIRPGTEFNSQKKMQTITLLTATTGGAEEQRQTDTILAYKYALTTRDKIISAEDIKNYCRMVLRGRLREVQVRRGTMVSDKPREGFIRTVEISVVPEDYAFYGSKYWNSFAEELKKDIRARAIDGVEYRVEILEGSDMLKHQGHG